MKTSNIKKMLTLLLAVVMVFAMTACGGGSSSDESSEESAASGGGFTIFNSKSEIQSDFEELAKAYTAETGVPVEVYYSNDTVSAHLATRYASHDPYTLNMVDAKDVYTLGAQYGADMSDQEWVGDTTEAIEVDGKVLGYPVCVEGRGLIYNGTAIKNITGEDFDPASITNLDEFKAFLDKLVAGGMETPVGILKEDWSLAAHYLATFVEEHDDVDAYVAQLKAGEVNLMEDAKFNAVMDTFDVLKEYNMAKAAPISIEREQVEQALSEGQIAFMFGGNWDFALMKDFDYTGGAGMMALPQDVTDDFTGKLLGGGTKFFYIDASEDTPAEEQQLAKDFLVWLTSSEAGQTFTSDTCGMVSAFGSNTVPCSDDLGASIQKFVADGKLSKTYPGFPDDHISVVGKNYMQKYLNNDSTREELAASIEEYWKGQA